MYIDQIVYLPHVVIFVSLFGFIGGFSAPVILARVKQFFW